MFRLEKHVLVQALAASTLAWACVGPAQAAIASLDVAGVDSFTEFDEGDNTVLQVDIAPFSVISRVSWDVNVTADDPSWISELSFAATDLALTAGVLVQPAADLESPGTARLSGSFDLAATGQSFAVGADGVVRVEFFEQFDDSEVSPDGHWNSGTLRFETASPVPESSTFVLAALGLGALGWRARRRVGLLGVSLHQAPASPPTPPRPGCARRAC